MRYNDNLPTPLTKEAIRLGDIGERFCDVENGQMNKDQTGDAGVKAGGLRAELRPRPRDVRRGGSTAGAGCDAEGTTIAFFRAGRGSVMMSGRGQSHSGGGPPSGGSVADGAGADR